MPASSSLMNLSVSGRIVGPSAGAKAEAAVIGDLDGLVHILHAKERCHRTEELFFDTRANPWGCR